MVNNEIKEEIKRYLETNENEDSTIQNLWDTGKAILREKFRAFHPKAAEYKYALFRCTWNSF